MQREKIGKVRYNYFYDTMTRTLIFLVFIGELYFLGLQEREKVLKHHELKRNFACVIYQRETC